MGGKSVAGKHGTARSGKRVPDEQAAVVLMLRLETLFLDLESFQPDIAFGQNRRLPFVHVPIGRLPPK